MNILHSKVIAQIVRFGIVGGICTVVHYGLYMLLYTALSANIAYIIGYGVSFVLNFYLTAYFTFKSAPSWRKLVGMMGAHGVNFLLHLLLLNLFIALGVPEALAPIPVFAIAIPVNFLLVRFVFKPKKVNKTIATCIALTITLMANAQNPTKLTETASEINQTAGRAQLGEFAPKFAELNDDVLFGQVWSRTDKLALRDRSLVTVTALVSSGIIDTSLKFHLIEAKKNGITRTEIAEILTQIAFYAGWPKAWGAFRLATEVWAEEDDATDARQKFEQEMIFPIGNPNTAYAKYFIGNSYLAPVSTEQVAIYNVTFEPGCRNNWHVHHATSGGGQMLICVAGYGWYQEEGKPARKLQPGDVVNIPANVKHWHGAAADSWFAHLAVEIAGENTSNEWLDPVTDEEYSKL